MLKNFKTIILAAGALLLAVSCNKNYLSTPPVGSLSPEGFYTTPAHLETVVLCVYSELHGVENYQ